MYSNQGRPQDLGGGVARIFFQIWKLHVTKRRENFENVVRFGVYILIGLYLEKLIYFYIKNNYDSNSFAMRLVIAPENFLKT